MILAETKFVSSLVISKEDASHHADGFSEGAQRKTCCPRALGFCSLDTYIGEDTIKIGHLDKGKF